jgi:hypothetical protein
VSQRPWYRPRKLSKATKGERRARFPPLALLRSLQHLPSGLRIRFSVHPAMWSWLTSSAKSIRQKACHFSPWAVPHGPICAGRSGRRGSKKSQKTPLSAPRTNLKRTVVLRYLSPGGPWWPGAQVRVLNLGLPQSRGYISPQPCATKRKHALQDSPALDTSSRH